MNYAISNGRWYVIDSDLMVELNVLIKATHDTQTKKIRLFVYVQLILKWWFCWRKMEFQWTVALYFISYLKFEQQRQQFWMRPTQIIVIITRLILYWKGRENTKFRFFFFCSKNKHQIFPFHNTLIAIQIINPRRNF